MYLNGPLNHSEGFIYGFPVSLATKLYYYVVVTFISDRQQSFLLSELNFEALVLTAFPAPQAIFLPFHALPGIWSPSFLQSFESALRYGYWQTGDHIL